MNGTHLRRHLPLVFLVAGHVGIGLLALLLPVSAVIRAGFGILAILVSIPLFYSTRDTTNRRPNVRPVGLHWTYAKLIVIFGATAVTATVTLGGRFVPVFVFLLVGYAVVTYQISDGTPPGLLLFEIGVLFAVPLVATYLETGIFFGGGDTFQHIRAVRGLLAAESVSGIAAVGVAYEQYPGFHLLIGGISEMTGVRIYDSIVLTGITLSSLLLLVAFLFTHRLFDNQIVALGCVLALSVLPIIGYYAIYFYPQSLAVFLLLAGLYVHTQLQLLSESEYINRYTLIGVLLVLLMTVTHHLTFLLFGVALVVLVCVGVGRRLQRSDSPHSNYQTKFGAVFMGLFGMVVLLSYWIYSPSIFIERLAVAFGGGGGDEVAGAGTVLLGVSQPDQIELSLSWLFGIQGLYAILFATLLFVGMYEYAENTPAYSQQSTFLITGFLFAILLLPLPLSITHIDRLRFVVALFAILPLGIAISRLCRTSTWKLLPVLLVIAVIGATSGFGAPIANDIDSTQSDERQLQVSYTDQEYATVGAVGEFVDESAETTLTTRSRTRRALRAQEMSYEEYTPLLLTDDGLTAPPGLVVVREQWTNYYVTLTGGKFAVSQQRFDDTEARQNKIYTADEVHVFWQSEEYDGLFGPENSAASTPVQDGV
jgi:hypothetical protein